MNKKVIASTLGVVFVTTILFSGCTKNNNGGIPTIHWYMKKAVDNVSNQEKVEAELNKTFEKEIGAKLQMHMIDNTAWEEKMNVLISSGSEFDICHTTATSNSFSVNVRREAFLDIKDLLNQYGKDILGKVDERALKVVTVDDKILAIPGQGQYSTPCVFSLKKEFVDKYNFDYKSVKTLRDLEPLFEQVVKNETGITPILYAPDEVNPKYTDGTIPGLMYSEETGKYEIEMTLPEMVERYKTLKEFYDKGYLSKDVTAVKDGMTEVKSGKYVMLAETGSYTEDGSKSSTFFGYPCVEILNGYRTITTRELLNQLNAVSATSKNPQKAIELLNLIWKDEKLSNTLAYGVEGVNYEVDTSKPYKSIIVKSGKEQTWGIWHNWVGPLWDQWDSSWNSKANLEMMKKMNDKAKVSSTLGFLFDVGPVKNIVAQVSATITEIDPILERGSMSNFSEYYDKALKKMEASGINKLRDEANKQLEEWKKSNKK